ncbi:hypothetical protein ACFFU8_09555 [Chromobacterium piscinae]|uniref:hypothetical protein n=1 Tax=Chromobacterium piscinae TaxID=686831 RepID=UPI001E5FBEBA|nr:hypothetical protein [Chromobacterium piscinae]MCD5327850.1 hypothetical protein [Chromobacterium piscinae]
MISLIFPADSPLTRWQQFCHQAALRKLLRDDSFYINELKALKQRLGGAEPDPALQSELEALHCMRYRDIPADLQAQLVDKVGQYLGLPIRGWPGTLCRRRYLLPALAGLVGIGLGLVLALEGTALLRADQQPVPARLSNAPASPAGPFPVAQPLGLPARDDTTSVFELERDSAEPGRALAALGRQLQRELPAAAAQQPYRLSVRVEAASPADDGSSSEPVATAVQ